MPTPSPSGDLYLTDPLGHRIPLGIQRNPQRKKWSIHVTAKGEVVLHIPQGMSDSEAFKHAQENAPWIFRQTENARKHPPEPAPTHFQDGEPFLLQGERYTLRIRPGLPLRAEPNPDTHEFWITLPPPASDPYIIRSLLLQSLQQLAKPIFLKLVNDSLQRAAAFHFPPATKLTIRATKSRWGSCSSQGHIMLNLYLIQAPPECIELVVMHELCHLREHNHSSRFYALLSQLLPNWKIRQQRLDRIPLGW